MAEETMAAAATAAEVMAAEATVVVETAETAEMAGATGEMAETAEGVEAVEAEDFVINQAAMCASATIVTEGDMRVVPEEAEPVVGTAAARTPHEPPVRRTPPERRSPRPLALTRGCSCCLEAPPVSNRCLPSPARSLVRPSQESWCWLPARKKMRAILRQALQAVWLTWTRPRRWRSLSAPSAAVEADEATRSMRSPAEGEGPSEGPSEGRKRPRVPAPKRARGVEV